MSAEVDAPSGGPLNAPLLASILSRCLAIWLLWIGLRNVTQYMWFASAGQADRNALAWMAGSTAGILAAAVLAWVQAPRFGRFLVRGLPAAEAEARDGFDVDAAERLIFGAIGLFLVAWSVPSIAYWGLRFQLVRPDPAIDVGPTRYINVANLFADVVRLGVGLWLLLRAEGVRRLVAGLRGLKREESA